MNDEYRVRGGVGGALPGAVGPSQLDGRAEWVPVRPPRDVLDALLARLGSEADLRKVVLAVFCPLRATLEGAPLGGLTAKLPQDLARELADAELNLCARVAAPAELGEYLVEVSRLLLHPPRRAHTYVRAAFAAAKAVLSADDARAIEERLPASVAAVWREAR